MRTIYSTITPAVVSTEARAALEKALPLKPYGEALPPRLSTTSSC
jgi:hypothetical protein